jgi:uncharacterized protein YciI
VTDATSSTDGAASLPSGAPVSGRAIDFLFICVDGPESAARRRASLSAHQRYIESVIERVRLAGPLLRENGSTFGSLYLVSADSATAARQLLEDDPFYTAGVWVTVMMHGMVAAAGTLVGGVTWPTEN